MRRSELNWRSIFLARDLRAASVLRARLAAIGSLGSNSTGDRFLRDRALTPATLECLAVPEAGTGEDAADRLARGETGDMEIVVVAGFFGSVKAAATSKVARSKALSGSDEWSKREGHSSWPAISMSVNMGEVFWLKLPGDSNEGVLRSVKVPEGGTDASIMRSLGEIVPGGPSGEKLARPRSLNERAESMPAAKSPEGRPNRSTSLASMKLGVDMTRRYVGVFWF